MNSVMKVVRDPWGFILSDRVQLLSGCLFVFSSAPREIHAGNSIGYMFLIGGILMIARAWHRIGDA